MTNVLLRREKGDVLTTEDMDGNLKTLRDAVRELSSTATNQDAVNAANQAIQAAINAAQSMTASAASAASAAASAAAFQYDLLAGNPKPLPLDVIVNIAFPRDVILRAGAPGSTAISDTPAANAATFTIARDGVEFGTFTFNAGTSVAVFAVAQDVPITAGQRFTVRAGNNTAGLSGLGVAIRLEVA